MPYPISVIIPVLNERDRVAEAIRSARLLDPLEVIVVDGGSRDGTLEIAGECGAATLRSLPGRGRQQNKGAAAARGEILLFLHADTRLDPAGGEQICRAVRDGGGWGGAFRQRIEAEGFLYRLLEWGNARRVLRRGIPYGDQGIFLKREIFEQLGGFPDVPLLEDLLLMKKARALGKPILLPGPLLVSPRRWQRHGVIRQTIRNRLILIAAGFGVSPARLARFYRRHDAGRPPRVESKNREE